MNELAYYNDNEPYVVEWLKNLAKEGLVTDGKIDGRPIQKIKADDLRGFQRCHFFAGIGGWDYALRLAGWPADRLVWTGSCPCQPFSSAGRHKGVEDERHLWPIWRPLIADCHPPTIFGEQVASKDGRLWLDRVRADLEEMGYAVGAADLCSASLNAPHIRQRLWWVANTESGRRSGRPRAEGEDRAQAENGSRMGKPDGTGSQQGKQAATATGHGHSSVSTSSRMANPEGSGAREDKRGIRQGVEGVGGRKGSDCGMGDTSSVGRCRRGENAPGQPAEMPWSRFELVQCGDGRARRVEPGSPPLATGIPARVGKLRAYGNAIVPEVAAEFIMAYLESSGSG